MKIIKLPLTVFLVVGLVLAGLLGQVAIDSYATNELPSITIAMVGTAQAQGADLNCDGEDDDVQWQAAVDYLPNGGKIVDLCGTTYTFGATVTPGNGDITIKGAGGKSYFENNGSTAIFSDGGYARVLFKDLRTDGGDITCTGTNSYRQNVWIGSTYYFEGPAGGSGGSGNCTEVIKTVTGDTGSYSASDCSGSIEIASGSGLLTAVAGAVLTVSADATMTRDVEWDTIGEIEAATSVNIIITTEIDSESELETLLADVADVFTDNDLIPEANLDVANAPTDEYSLTWEADDGKPRWQLISGGAGAGNCSVAIATFGGDSGSDYTASSCSGAIAVIGGSDISTVSDGAGNVTVSADATLTRDIEWDTIGEIEAATSVNIIIYGEIDTEAELEAILSDVSNLIVSTEIDSEAELEALIGDAVIVDGEIDTEAELEAMLIGVTDVFTDNDGALDDDDVTSADVGLASASLDDTDATVEWEDAADLESDGSLSIDVIAAAEMADADHGDVSWSSGVATVDSGAVLLTELTGGNWKVIYTNGSGVVTELSLGANNTYLKSTGAASAPIFEALSGDDMGDVDTEAELESALGDVTDVFTDNDTIDFSDYINATAGEGIDFSDDEILAETATASNLGIAMFFAQHFGLAAGNVTIAANAIDDTLIDWGSGANQVDTDDIPEGSTNKFEGTTAGDYLTLTVEDIDHDPILRYMPEIFACSMSGNTSTSIGDCESVGFGGIEFHVVEFTTGDMAFFHLKTPATFGYGGNTTMTVSYGIRVEDGSSGSSLVMATKIGTSIADALTEDWHNSTGLAWSQNDEITWTADLVINESLGTGALDLVIGVKLVSEDWDATNIYVDKVIYQAWGV